MPLKTRRTFTASFTGDLRTAVEVAHEAHAASPLLLMGYSLGANVVSTFLAEDGSAAPVAGAVTLSNPWDLFACDQHLT